MLYKVISHDITVMKIDRFYFGCNQGRPKSRFAVRLFSSNIFGNGKVVVVEKEKVSARDIGNVIARERCPQSGKTH